MIAKRSLITTANYYRCIKPSFSRPVVALKMQSHSVTTSWLWGDKNNDKPQESAVQSNVSQDSSENQNNLPNVENELQQSQFQIPLEITKPVEKIAFNDLPRFEEKQKLSWKYEYLHAWLQSLTSGAIKGLLLLKKSVFGVPLRQDILGQVLKYERSWLEAGTESTKALGQVRGSTRKFAPQKGRGKARVGTVRAPQWRGGYTVHGPRPHDKTIDINRKIYNQGIRIALSTKFAQDQLRIVDSFASDSTSSSAVNLKTPFQPSLEPGVSHKKPLIDVLQALQVAGKKVYFVHGEDMVPTHLIRIADQMTPKRRGEKPVMVSHANQVSAMALLEYDVVVLDIRAVERLEKMYDTTTTA